MDENKPKVNEPKANVENIEVKEEKKEKWGTKVEFILTCLSYVIGFGNVWRFPYVCYKNGGGAFLIPYFLSLVFLGLPIMLLEMTLGQYSARGKVVVWKFMPIFSGTGIAMMIVVTMQVIYYNVLVAWAIIYFLSSFTLGPLPWKDCGHDWNTWRCTNGSVNETYKSPSDEYLHRNVLQMNVNMEEINVINWKVVMTLLIAWFLVYFSLYKGVKSMGKVAYLTTVFPYICLTVLLIRGLTLDGALDGIKFYITPVWEKLMVLDVWVDASQQIFFSLGVSWGSIITLASYNDFENHLIRDAVIISFGNSFTSIFAGFVIFSYMGSVAYERNVDISKVAAGGPGLAFIIYPEAVSKFPVGQIFSAIFFFMLILLGLGSQTPNVESIISTLFDFRPEKKKYRIVLLFIICSVCFFLGIIFCTQAGIYWFELFSGFCGSISAMFIGLTEVIAITWFYGIDKFFDHIKEMVGRYPQPYLFWKVVLKFVTPIYLSIILLLTIINTKSPTYESYEFPVWTVVLGWAINVGAVISIPCVAIFYLNKYFMNKEVSFRDVSAPQVEWRTKEATPDKPIEEVLDNTEVAL